MYKDPGKQREANREQMRRARAKGNTNQGNTAKRGRVTQEDWEAVGKDRSKALPLCPYCLKRPILSDNAIACEECSQKTLISPKRGKDIKYFGDLPMDVQATIDRLSVVDGKIDQAAKDRRTAIAIHYQTTCFGPQGM